MAEAVGAASAVVTLLEVSAEILNAGYSYLRKVAKGPARVRKLLTEVSAIDTLLADLRDLAKPGAEFNSTLSSLAEKGHLEECAKVLGEARVAVEKRCLVDGKDVKNAAKRLLYPLKEDELQELITRVEVSRRHLTDAVILDSRTALSRLEVSNKFIGSQLQSKADDAESERLLSWIGPTIEAVEAKHVANMTAMHPNTGAWVYKSPEFNQVHQHGGCLWLTGPPGSGKTILSSSIINFTQRQCLHEEAGLTFWYFDSNLPLVDQPEQALVAFTKQLLKQNPASIRHVRKSMGAKNWRYFQDFRQIFIVIDALDEANDTSRLSDILQSLQKGENAPRYSVLVTSRDSISLEHLLKPSTPLRIAVLDRNKGDLDAYVNDTMASMINQQKIKFRKQSLIDTTKITVLQRSGGLFLQSKFHLEFISKTKSDKALVAALDSLPSVLNESYENMLHRIKRHNKGLIAEARRILIWLSHGFMALSPKLLAEAAAINEEDDYLDQDAISTDPEDLLSVLGSLVTIDRTCQPAAVSLSHLSLFEYLHSDAIKHSTVSDFYIDATEAHQYIAQVCGQYLGFSNFAIPRTIPRNVGVEQHVGSCLPRKAFASGSQLGANRRWEFKRTDRIPENILERLNEYALLDYAAQYWPSHVKDGYSRTTEKMEHNTDQRSILTKFAWFLEPDSTSRGNFNSWYEVYHSYCSCPGECEKYHAPIVLSVIMGLDIFFDVLLTTVQDLDARLSWGRTALPAAVYGGSTHIVQKLLEAGAIADQALDIDTYNGLTALHLAAEYGNVEIVKLLLAYGASVSARTITKTTPFYQAVRGGHREVIDILHEAGSDINAKTWDSWTPLFDASRLGDLPLVEKLLAWGADPSIRTVTQMSPVGIAQHLAFAEISAVFEEYFRSRGRLHEYEELGPPKRGRNAKFCSHCGDGCYYDDLRCNSCCQVI